MMISFAASAHGSDSANMRKASLPFDIVPTDVIATITHDKGRDRSDRDKAGTISPGARSSVSTDV